MSIPPPLDRIFNCVSKTGWIAFQTKSRKWLDHFGTQRVGKLMPDGVIQFTVGATLTGQKANLNETIKRIIEADGVCLLPRETTSGSRAYDAPYPAFDTKGVSQEVLARIAHRVEGAVLQVSMNFAP